MKRNIPKKKIIKRISKKASFEVIYFKLLMIFFNISYLLAFLYINNKKSKKIENIEKIG